MERVLLVPFTSSCIHDVGTRCVTLRAATVTMNGLCTRTAWTSDAKQRVDGRLGGNGAGWNRDGGTMERTCRTRLILVAI